MNSLPNIISDTESLTSQKTYVGFYGHSCYRRTLLQKQDIHKKSDGITNTCIFDCQVKFEEILSCPTDPLLYTTARSGRT